MSEPTAALNAQQTANGAGEANDPATTTASAATLPAPRPTAASTRPRVAIGAGIGCTTVRVLDDRLVPCDDGEVGEIYLAGPALARGYLGRPDLTAERFVADPHGVPGTRMYRTGDLGMWRDGELEHRGRADDQVKIRGFRVEPGELTAAAEALPGVREAFAVAVPLGGGLELALVVAGDAGIAGRGAGKGRGDGNSNRGSAAFGDRMLGTLRSALPDHLIPSRVVRIGRLPRTPVGKVDAREAKAIVARAAEAARATAGGAAAPGAAGTVVAAAGEPADGTIAAVAGCMSEVLGRPVGADDDFFALGGHSLTALRLTAQLETALGDPVSLRELFAAPTPRSLGEWLDARGIGARQEDAAAAAAADAPTAEIASENAPASVPSPAQERMLLLQDIVGGGAYAIPLHWRLTGPGLTTDVVERALRLLVSRHSTLRTAYPIDGGVRRRRDLPASSVPIRTVRPAARPASPRTGESTDADREAFATLISASAAEPFDLAREAPLRLLLAPAERSPDDPGAASVDLGIVVHHVATDEHGLDVLQRELVQVVEAMLRGKDPVLTSLPLTSDGLAAEQRALADASRDADLAAWRERLAGHEGSGELPADARGDSSGVGVAEAAVELAERAADPADRERSAHPAPGAHPAHPDAPSLPAHPDSPTHPTHPDPDAFTRAAARLRVTPFMLVHAATALALQRAGAGDDLVLASPVADRSVAGSEALVDCLTNTVAVRQRGVGRGTIADALGAACEAVLDALERQSTSFDEVQRALGGAPLSDVLVGAYHLDRATVSHGGMRCDSRPVATANAKAALTPTLVIGPDGARVLMEYDRAAFTAERAGAIATAIARLIAELVTRDPQTPVAALELTTPAERERLLGPAAGEAHDLPIEPFGAHFLRAAEISSDRPAVTVRGRTLSYREVAERSLAVARSIRDAGVGPGEVVAVFTDRGLDMITTHVGTLLSGAAYLAVDPASPADRIAALFAALPPALVITSGCEPALPGGLEAPVVRRGGQPNASHPDAAQPDAVEPDAVEPDAARPDAVGCSRGDSLADVHADIAAESANLPVDSLAYVIFTSGTTGTPKPVGVSHRGISKLIATQRLRLGSAGGKRVLSFATPTFDAAFWQLCGTLCDGGELVVMPDECRLPGPAFVEFIERERIDVVSVPPSVLGALPPEATLPARAQLIVGAERLPASLVRRWAPRHALVNAYGPSEATVNTTLHRCAPDETEPVPIGQIDPGARGYVVDTALRLCPDEFPGELLIGGDGVALGYLGDPAKTAGRFIADPFSSGRRCYRSGDRVARRAAAPGSAGELVFIGRDDDQVKVRGFRVEPGEIAAALESLPGVLQAAVVVRTSASGHQQLVGYVVPSSVPDPVGGTGAVLHRATGVAAVSGAVDEAGIRASLRGRLSAHLVPDRVVVIDSIPRTSSGKLDRRALPDPTATNADGRDAPLPSAGLPGDDVAVSSESEGNAAGSTATADPDVRVICDAFATALRVTDVHPDDDFFALGGSSLVAATLLRDIAGRTGRAPTFAELLASPTPRSLAGAVPRNDPLDVRLSLRSAPARDALAPVWFTPPLAGMSWCYAGLRRWLDPRRELIGLQAPNLSGSAPAPATFDDLVMPWADAIERDLRARRRTETGPAGRAAEARDAPVHLVGWSFGGAAALGVASELQRRGIPTGLVAMLDSYPVAEWADTAPTPAEGLRSALGMLGVDLSLDEAAGLDERSAAALMAEANPLLTGLDAFDPACMIDNFHAGPALERTARFDGYSGDLLVFTAERTASAMATDWRAWRPFVDGEVRRHAVDAAHQDMVRDDALAEIGPALDAALAELP